MGVEETDNAGLCAGLIADGNRGKTNVVFVWIWRIPTGAQEEREGALGSSCFDQRPDGNALQEVFLKGELNIGKDAAFL